MPAAERVDRRRRPGRAGQRKLCKVELRYLAEPLARVRAKLATWSGRQRGVFTGERASINAATGVGQRTRSQ